MENHAFLSSWTFWYSLFPVTFPSALISHNGYGLAVTRESGISEVPVWQSTLSGPYPHVARSTWNDILTQIYPQMYTFYKNTFKVFQLSINMTLKTVSYALKKHLIHVFCCSCQRTHWGYRIIVCSRPFYPLGSDRNTLFYPKAIQLNSMKDLKSYWPASSRWSLDGDFSKKKTKKGDAHH